TRASWSGSHGYTRIEDGKTLPDPDHDTLVVAQDRLAIDRKDSSRNRFIEAATTAFKFGKSTCLLTNSQGEVIHTYRENLVIPSSGKSVSPATPNKFSFNAPQGACPRCRGFGRIIEIDDRLIIPDTTLSIDQGAIRAFQGEVYSESLRDLKRANRREKKVRMHVPWNKLSDEEKSWVFEGTDGYVEDDGQWKTKWYGVRRFFKWLEGNTYKMHVRVFLSKFRSYVTCPDCGGTRLKPESLLWTWRGHTLPALYTLPISDLLSLIKADSNNHEDSQAALALQAIKTRLEFLDQVGLGYLNLDRASRTLSGGETQRVNLTACLGTSLVDTLYVLDEPSIGLHARDIDRLVGIMKRLTSQGNTVIVVEHDEAVMRAADQILELGPVPGRRGGQLIFQGSYKQILRRNTLTGAYLSGKSNIEFPQQRRPVTRRGNNAPDYLHLKGVSKNNLQNLSVSIPLQRLVCLSGVSGSGKSTLLHNAIYSGLLESRGTAAEDPAEIASIEESPGISEIVAIDQTPLTRTPRSNPALYVDVWDVIRELFAKLPEAKQAGHTASTYSFNSGNGRCDHCSGLGYEKIEMQFLSDVFVVCPSCGGKRFKPDVLEIKYNEKSLADVLDLEIEEAVVFFADIPKIVYPLKALIDVGLGYLRLGQPLNTLSGGEAQRVKLIKYLANFKNRSQRALILLDEPTTGLHRDDIKKLIAVFQKLVEQGNSLIVIEHQMDVLAAADWVIEMGPEAGMRGGKIVAEGTPEAIGASDSQTARFLAEHLNGFNPISEVNEAPINLPRRRVKPTVRLRGAREHNLKSVNLDIPHHQLNVITGVSGSGKSTLAFDIIFAEGQRRFMETMSSYTRQFVEQLPKPDIDALSGIPPTVAIEQRITRGSRKSTVATITEVAQYLRLLYARIGIQHSPTTDQPIQPASQSDLLQQLKKLLASPSHKKEKHLYLCSPVIRARKGHHQPLADWAEKQGYLLMRCDAELVKVREFKKLDRYSEHDVEIVIADLGQAAEAVRNDQAYEKRSKHFVEKSLEKALELGKGACFLLRPKDSKMSWFSTTNTDLATGESFPDLDPKHFSWNSARGWCPTCRGHGRIYDWMKDDMDQIAEATQDIEGLDHGAICPDCNGARINRVSRAVKLHLKDGKAISLPEILALSASDLLYTLKQVKLDTRARAVMKDIFPQVEERLKFMDRVGLSYLSLDRATNTLSGGEAQRIRLAAQLGSNLSGVLYVLDEPSIGLHARDNDRLIQTLESLRDQGNTILVVEHDDDTMRAADNLIDVGPRAGVHGGEIVKEGHPRKVVSDRKSLTAQYLKNGINHPTQGSYRELPTPPKTHRSKSAADWILIEEPAIRNLKGGRLSIPLNRLCVICGPSGAGKSTLIRDLLSTSVNASLERGSTVMTGEELMPFISVSTEETYSRKTLPVKRVSMGEKRFRKVIEVDQSPIGKTPRSTPATYLGAFDIIRDYFASLPEAKMRGMSPGTFSFNTKGGRCESCKGAGRIKLEMAFMPDQFVECEDCKGSRYGEEMQSVQWNGKSIADVLKMTFEEAARFFDFHSQLKGILDLMVETGLGYLELGQSSPTLSGGEAQRLKLVTELAQGQLSYKERSRGIASRNLYILEEPTIGLHMADCERLIDLLHRLVDQGHTCIVIEHHLDIIAEADYVVEMGPDGGIGGGEILYQGPLKDIQSISRSPTAPYLKRFFAD
ncbi:MAG: excinuclease ABC subunit UvrA, partial [Verrucomicrobiota bacterium]